MPSLLVLRIVLVAGAFVAGAGGLLFVARRRKREAADILRTVPDSIRRRLGLHIALIVLIPVVLIAGASLLLGIRASEHRLLTALEAAAEMRVGHIETWRDELRLDVAMLHGLELDNLQALLSSPRASQEFEDAYAVESQRLLTALEPQGKLDVIVLADAQGEVVLSTASSDEQPDISKAAFFPAGLESPYVGAVTHSILLDAPAITVAMPVPGTDGSLGILVGQATLTHIRAELADRADLIETGEAYVLDGEGRFLAGALADSMSALTVVSSEGVDSLLSSRRDTSGRYTNYRDEPVLGVYRWLPDLELAVVVEAERNEIVSMALPTTGYTLAIAVVSLALALLGGALVADAVSRPISEMAEAATRFAQGDLTATIPIERQDELGQMALAINEMAERLRETVSDLEARVADRTADLERRSTRLQTAAGIARQAASIREVDELLRVVADQVVERLGFYHVGVYLLDSARRLAVLRASAGAAGEQLLTRGFQVAMDEEVVGMGRAIAAAASSGRAAIVSDVLVDERYLAAAELPETLSEMSLPIRVRDEIVGVLDLQSDSPGVFSEDDVTYLQTLGDQIGLAVENAWLLAETTERLRETERLVQAQRREGWWQMASERPVWSYVYDGVEVMSVDEAAASWLSSTSSEDAPDVVLPIGERGDEVGSVKLRLRGRDGLSRDQMQLARAIIGEAGSALERARLFGTTQAALQEASILYHCSRAMMGANSEREVVSVIADHVATSDIDRVILLARETLVDAAQPTVRVVATWSQAEEGSVPIGQRWPLDRVPAVAGATSGCRAVNDVAASEVLDSVSRDVLLEDIGVRSALILPLSLNGETLRWLILGTSSVPHTFRDSEMRLYRGLADQAAIVIRNFQLLELATKRAERERRIAEAGARIRRSTDIQTILQTSVSELARVLGAREGSIRLHSDGDQDGPVDRQDEPTSLEAGADSNE
ncbi:MAG: GAF domain-containing protein [Anaerolineae bacterium]